MGEKAMISESTAKSNDIRIGQIQISVPVAVFLSYVITGYVGLHLNAVNTFATLVWPPAGIAFAAFFMRDHRLWPAVFFAAFLINVSIGASFPVAFCIALGNTLGPLAGASFVKWYTNYNPMVLRLLDNVGIVLSSFIVPVITATVGVGALWLGGTLSSAAFGATWSTWWMGDMLGILVLSPFIMKWFSPPLFERTTLQRIELIVASLSVAATAYYIFWTPINPFTYGLFIPLTWVALRTGPHGITLSLVLVALIAVIGTITGHGSFLTLGLPHLQIFLATISSVFLIFTAVVEERKNVFTTLTGHVDELEDALFKISAEDEAKKEFLAVLAHELRNPLATILNSIELINLEGFSASNAKKLLEIIAERSHAMVHLLDDLLDISRISQKKLSVEKQTVSVGQFIDKLILTAQPLISKYEHTFSITRPDEELYLHADPVRLEQIFTNLVVNAAKFTKTPGSIEALVRREKHMAVAYIRDSGMGIPENMLEKIFEPFYQINRGTSAKEGIGVGLPLTRRLVEIHGGTIEARSQGIGRGSEFIVRLPLLRQSEHVQSYLPSASRARVHKGRKPKRTFKILMVDDNKEGVDALARLLELRGHTTAVAYSGSEAVHKALAFKPEVVLLDIGMPDMNGYEVAIRLRAQNKTYFLVALTGYGQVEDVERSKQVGFNQHITKPAELKEIEAALRKVPRSLGTS